MTASANRDRFRSIAYRYRNLPAKYGLRPCTVSVILRSHSGTYAGEGSETETVTAITESGGYPPKVRELNSEELALAGLNKGTLEVGPVTPDHTGGGTSIATLLQTAADKGDLVLFRVTTPRGTADYRLVDFTDTKALHYKLRLQPVSE